MLTGLRRTLDEDATLRVSQCLYENNHARPNAFDRTAHLPKSTIFRGAQTVPQYIIMEQNHITILTCTENDTRIHFSLTTSSTSRREGPNHEADSSGGAALLRMLWRLFQIVSSNLTCHQMLFYRQISFSALLSFSPTRDLIFSLRLRLCENRGPGPRSS